MNRARRRLTVVLLALLAAQFLLGMVSNFYAQLPHRIPGTRGSVDNRLAAAARWALLHGPTELQAHVALGIALGIGAISVTALSLRSRTRPWLPLAPLGLVATAGAGLAGAAFLAYGQNDLYSLLMSIAFLAALFTYGALLYLTHPTSETRPDTRDEASGTPRGLRPSAASRGRPGDGHSLTVRGPHIVPREGT